MARLTTEETMQLLKDDTIGYIDKAPFIPEIARLYSPIISTREVAEILKVSKPTARRLIAEAYESKVFPVAQTVNARGGRYRVPRDPFLRYVFLGEVHPLGIKKIMDDDLQKKKAKER